MGRSCDGGIMSCSTSPSVTLKETAAAQRQMCASCRHFRHARVHIDLGGLHSQRHRDGAEGEAGEGEGELDIEAIAAARQQLLPHVTHTPVALHITLPWLHLRDSTPQVSDRRCYTRVDNKRHAAMASPDAWHSGRAAHRGPNSYSCTLTPTPASRLSTSTCS